MDHLLEDPEKLYFSIGEVAKAFDVNTSLIRYWENEFDILQPKKNKKGNRLFSRKDVENIGVIYHLVKERGFTLDGAKKKLKENREDTAKIAETVSRLQQIKNELLNIKKEL
ncbi:MAG: MerR family transcriptional regulator [Bacteroidota bacterium]|nr:MerR family transcriptional regulator [Bacteroidota bacterium]MDX5429153.1 MerR family transcriptional regulator [Bacteroidota bacterium]MDX5448481.1 MerR family transcriptional regulator [Bacteroidota bacterium]MDX5506791.1 MerR family transcriptional regulator [Bacteroidota bacterium]